MTESKHTETPWKYSDAYYETQVDIRDEGGRRIAVVVTDYPMMTCRMEANAHFIVRACNCHDELLEALEDLVSDWEITGELELSVLSNARAAIAKARGEQ